MLSSKTLDVSPAEKHALRPRDSVRRRSWQRRLKRAVAIARKVARLKKHPPYDAPYWAELTDRQKINDLVHKFAQRTGHTYPEAYAVAAGIIDAPGPGTYAVRLARVGKLEEAIEKLIEYHGNANA